VMAYPTKFNVQQLYLDIIKARPTHRGIDQEAVGLLADSMEKLGLRQPITVEPREQGEGYGYWIVAGAHRLVAARKLGWETIPCYVEGANARLWEISENLHRAELSVAERSEQIAEWVGLTEAKPGQVVQVSKGGRGKEGGISKAARELPVAGSTPEAKRKTVERALKVAGIVPEARKAAHEAGLKAQSDLLKVASYSDSDQLEMVAKIAAEKTQKTRPYRAKRDAVAAAHNIPTPTDAARPAELVCLEGMTASEFAEWIKATTASGNLAESIRLLEETAALLRDKAGKSAAASLADKYITRAGAPRREPVQVVTIIPNLETLMPSEVAGRIKAMSKNDRKRVVSLLGETADIAHRDLLAEETPAEKEERLADILKSVNGMIPAHLKPRKPRGEGAADAP
jgi:uncharacterized ParB-like nuclease family protein